MRIEWNQLISKINTETDFRTDENDEKVLLSVEVVEPDYILLSGWNLDISEPVSYHISKVHNPYLVLYGNSIAVQVNQKGILFDVLKVVQWQ